MAYYSSPPSPPISNAPSPDDGEASSSNDSRSHWSFEFHPLIFSRGEDNYPILPLRHHRHHHHYDTGGSSSSTNNNNNNNFVACHNEEEILILSISIPLAKLFVRNPDAYRAFVPLSTLDSSNHDNGDNNNNNNNNNKEDDDDDDDNELVMRQASAARVALADYAARCLADLLPIHHNNANTNNNNNNDDDDDVNRKNNNDNISIIIQTMGQQSRNPSRGEGRRRQQNYYNGMTKNVKKMKKKTMKTETLIPFVLERTDCMIVQVPPTPTQPLHVTSLAENTSSTTTTTLQLFLHATVVTSSSSSSSKPRIHDEIRTILSPTLQQLQSRLTSSSCYQHVACVVLQRILRSMLLPPRFTRTSSSSSSSLLPPPHKPSQQAKEQNHATTTSEKKQVETQHYYLNAIAFIADGSLLPRKSGRSMLPMPSPPSLPFVSPQHAQQEHSDEKEDTTSKSNDSSQLTKIVTVNVGKFWRRFLNEDGSTTNGDRNLGNIATATTKLPTTNSTTTSTSSSIGSKTVTMRGMIIPRGVTLIVGGGYHGKSTLLQQALVMGVYDKIPGDGRERCVSHEDAVSIRAEDGRYVNNVNISAFISELPKIKKSWAKSTAGMTPSTSSVSTSSSSLCDTTTIRDRYRNDVTCFGTKDASGSTSQAANVIEALECGASALLVDEDVSAANFMARDGRMRAMIMNEPITPLLYRVNGLYLSKGVSTVVVVGGVGDWLDVADAVVLMQDYVAYDGLKKARSVSYQFSYGHVQYAGRGVVHRLPWEVKDNVQQETSAMEEEANMTVSTLSPLRRRPESHCVMNKFNDVAMLDSNSSRLWFFQAGVGEGNVNDDRSDTNMESFGDDDNDGDDEDEGIVDMSKCSQLIDSSSEQLYGCGVCVLWLLHESRQHPGEDLLDLLIRMENELDYGGREGGMNKLLSSLEDRRAFANNEGSVATLFRSSFVLDLWETVGYAYRPRRHEVAMALTRMRGMKFERLPEKPKEVAGSMSPEEAAKLLEEESKKRTLAELWANRRRK